MPAASFIRRASARLVAARVAAGVGGVIVVGVLVVSCAMQGAGTPAPSAPPAPSASAEPTATSSPAAAPEPTTSEPSAPADTAVPSVTPPPSAGSGSTGEPAPTGDPASFEAFTTHNGTATFDVPTGWRIADESTLGINHGNVEQWVNQLRLIDGQGRQRAAYLDGYQSDIGWGHAPWALLESRPIAASPAGTELFASLWWMDLGDRIEVMAAVTEEPGGEAPNTFFLEAEGRVGLFSASLDELEGCTDIADVTDAESCLSTPEVATTLAVLASLELHDVPWDAMPPGIE